MKLNKRDEPEVKDALTMSKYKFSAWGMSCAISRAKDLVEEFEIIKKIYKKKPFVSFRYDIEWR